MEGNRLEDICDTCGEHAEHMEHMENIWKTYGKHMDFKVNTCGKTQTGKRTLVSSWIFPTKTIHKNVELFGDGYVYIKYILCISNHVQLVEFISNVSLMYQHCRIQLSL